jgi:hypothetical protein
MTSYILQSPPPDFETSFFVVNDAEYTGETASVLINGII